jgi:hypothetical protein
LELLTGLNEYRNGRRSASRNEPGQSEIEKTQLMITGHSFGGLVIYSALSEALMERARPRPGASGARSSNVKSFGDFVMLVNPAFEGSTYEPLYQIAKHQEYNDEQRPVMMIVTSEADSATRVAFPLGRTVSTLFEPTSSPEEARILRTAVGHNERYQTHSLSFVATEPVPPKPMGQKVRAFPLLQATAEWDQDSLLNYLFDIVDDTLVGGGEYGKGVSLTPESFAAYDPRHPLLVVKTDKEIIADHNSIYSERFINFAQLFYIRHILHGKPLPGKRKAE